VRFASVGRLISTAEGTGWVTIRVAETRGARALWLPKSSGMRCCPWACSRAGAGTVWVVVGRAFAPLLVIDRILRERRPDDLSPITAPVPVEVQRLVGGLNGFMHRLRASIDRLGGLVAEAAHQVRNPLASLRAQSELALLEPDDGKLRERVAHPRLRGGGQPSGVAAADGCDHLAPHGGKRKSAVVANSIARRGRGQARAGRPAKGDRGSRPRSRNGGDTR
jgi:signal transduction histidine kinase